jgi:hypothetical protein
VIEGWSRVHELGKSVDRIDLPVLIIARYAAVTEGVRGLGGIVRSSRRYHSAVTISDDRRREGVIVRAWE